MNEEKFIDEVKKLNINLTDLMLQQLKKYANLLLEYNKKINITAINDLDGIYLKHFYDSLTIIKASNLNENISILDVGSGGGFPGIVLKILYPNLSVTLLDGNHKKSDFQKYIIKELNLKNIESINERAEDYFKKGKKYDLVVARAVSALNILTELCLPFVKINGNFIAMKSSIENELETAMYAVNYLGGNIENIVNFALPIENSERNLITIKKIAESPNNYPRSYDKIKKKPLAKK